MTDKPIFIKPNTAMTYINYYYDSEEEKVIEDEICFGTNLNYPFFIPIILKDKVDFSKLIRIYRWLNYNDYNRNLKGMYISTKLYPLLWIWYEFIAILDTIWRNILRATYYTLKFLNQSRDFVSPYTTIPLNPIAMLYLFGLNANKGKSIYELEKG